MATNLDDLANSMMVDSNSAEAGDQTPVRRSEVGSRGDRSADVSAGQQRSGENKGKLRSRAQDTADRLRKMQSAADDDQEDDQDDQDDQEGDLDAAEDGADEDEDRNSPDTEDQDDDGDEDDPLDGAFDEDDEADQEGDDDDDGDDFDTSQLGDDAKFSVTVDGEEVTVSLGDLKRRYAGEGAIDKRLQEATETRRKASEDYDKSSHIIQSVMKQFGENLFRRTVPKPDASLRASNPAAYFMQKEQYDEEGAALQQEHGKLMQLLQEADQSFAAMKQEHRKQAAAQLRTVMPGLFHPEKGPKLRDTLIATAREIGYSDEDIANCTDPLMFKAIAFAARGLRSMKGASVKPSKQKERTTRTKGSQNVRQENVVRSAEKKAMSRARKTRNLDDIESTMLVQAPRKRR